MRRQLRASIELAAARPALSLGLRAATATIPALAIGESTGHPAFLWMAFGGWLGTLSDPGGPYRTRAAALFSYLVWGSAAAGAATLAARFPWAGVAVLALGVALASAARAWGDAASTVGTCAATTLCIAFGYPAGPAVAAQRAALVAAGSLLAIGLALGPWPVHPYAPVRRALADCYRALAELAERIAELGSDREAAWSAIAVRDPPRVRAALERARTALAVVRRGRPAASARGEQMLVLYEVGDLLLAALGHLGESLAAGSHDARGLRDVARSLGATAATIEDRGDAPAPPELHDATLAQLAHEVLLNARFAVQTAAALRSGAAAPLSASPLPEPPARTPPLEALAPGSPVARHAARAAVTVAAGATVAALLHLQKAHWVIVTIVFVLQPDLGGTLRRGLQRVAGTVLGAIVAALLAPLVHRPLVFAALLFPLTAIAMALRPLNYGLYSALVTPVFLLMAESLSGDWHLAGVRVVNTLIGGTLALAGGLWLWPLRETVRLPLRLAAAVDALRAYAEALRTGGDEAAARRRFGLAAAAADASLQRLLPEPGATETQIESAMAVLTYARRLRFTLGSLPPDFGARLAAQLDPPLRDVAEALRSGRVPAAAVSPTVDVPGAAAERVARQVDVLRSAATRLASAEA